ncbi:MAG: ferritin-like domain-containing protein [Desulfobacterales bacterium]
MDNNELIKMLNRDLADEHAAILRYLVHGYQEGEDTPIGASLLSRAREEMWHMHWLGMIIGNLGGEPDLKPAPYPFDPSNRATIFQSYVDYEKKLIPHYQDEAGKVKDAHIRRVLDREAWESEIHARKFDKILKKLKPDEASGKPGGENKLPVEFVNTLQEIIKNKYTQMLQRVRSAWVFQKDAMLGWQLMDFSMTKMKQLAHVSEEVAVAGINPLLKLDKSDLSASVAEALKNALEDLQKSRMEYITLQAGEEIAKHAGLANNMELALNQEEYEASEMKEWLNRYIR